MKESDPHVFKNHLMQVTVRRFDIPTDAEAATLLQSQVEFMSKQYPDLEIVEATSAATIAGHRTNSIRGRFSLFMTTDDGRVALPVLSRAHVIFSPGKAFTLGLSSSANPDYFDEADFDQIIGSVQIGRH